MDNLHLHNKKIAENRHPNCSILMAQELRGITRFSKTRFLIPNCADASVGVYHPVRNKQIFITQKLEHPERKIQLNQGKTKNIHHAEKEKP